MPGNAGGPGRPCAEAIERDYLTALSDECGPDVWRRIVQLAVADAEGGNATARVWLAKYLLPETRPGFTTPLMRAALDDALDIDPVDAELGKARIRGRRGRPRGGRDDATGFATARRNLASRAGRSRAAAGVWGDQGTQRTVFDPLTIFKKSDWSANW